MTQRKKQKKKHTSILKNYARAYIPIAVPTVTRLRTYTVIQRIEPQESEIKDDKS